MLEQFAENAVGTVLWHSWDRSSETCDRRGIPPAAARRRDLMSSIDVEGENVSSFRWRGTPSDGGTMRLQECNCQISGLLIEYGAIA